MMKSFGDMVKQAQKMQKQMSDLQEKLVEERHEATAGGAGKFQKVAPAEIGRWKGGGVHRLPSVPLACNSAARLMPARMRR